MPFSYLDRISMDDPALLWLYNAHDQTHPQRMRAKLVAEHRWRDKCECQRVVRFQRLEKVCKIKKYVLFFFSKLTIFAAQQIILYLEIFFVSLKCYSLILISALAVCDAFGFRPFCVCFTQKTYDYSLK